MPRKKKEINPKQRERLQLILKEQKISQKDLAKKIFLSEKTISAMVTGKSSLTHATALALMDLFPEAGYRYEWIMGFDDYKTVEEYVAYIINTDVGGKAIIEVIKKRLDDIVEKYREELEVID